MVPDDAHDFLPIRAGGAPALEVAGAPLSVLAVEKQSGLCGGGHDKEISACPAGKASPPVERPCRGIGGDDDYCVPDFTLAERKVWRIALPDGTLRTIPVVNTRSTGLRARLPPAMTKHIRRQRESGSKNSAA